MVLPRNVVAVSRVSLSGVLLLAVVSLTAASPSASSVGVCSLVTRAEAASALGRSLPAGVARSMPWVLEGRSMPADYCFYGSEVVVARVTLGPKAASLIGQYRRSLSGQEDYQTVTGLGDEAFFAKGQLAIRKGAVGLIVDVGQARGGGEKERTSEKRLAQQALGRL